MSMDPEAHFGTGLRKVSKRRDRNGHVVTDAAGFDDCLVGMLLDQDTAQQSDHGISTAPLVADINWPSASRTTWRIRYVPGAILKVLRMVIPCPMRLASVSSF